MRGANFPSLVVALSFVLVIADPEHVQQWRPPVLDVTTSPTILRMAERAAKAPTAEEVFELARRIGSEDVALKLGPQNFSMCGHAAVKQRVLETADWLQNEAPRQYEEHCHYVLRMRKRMKKFNTPHTSDRVIAELMKTNQTTIELAQSTLPPGGYPQHTVEDIVDVVSGLREALEEDPNDVMWLWLCGFYTAWGPGLRPLSSKWSKEDEYAPVPAYVDEAERLFQRALKVDPGHEVVNCLYGKLLEAFRGDLDGAEERYQAALKHDRNSIPALALYRFSVLQLFGNKFKIDTDIISVDDGTSWFMKHLRNDTAAYKGRKDILLDKSRLMSRNLEAYWSPVWEEGDLRPLWSSILTGTVEGTDGMLPREWLQMPAPTKEELQNIGYSEEEAAELCGGSEPMFLPGVQGLWHWHGLYRQFWKNANATPDQWAEPAANYSALGDPPWDGLAPQPENRSRTTTWSNMVELRKSSYYEATGLRGGGPTAAQEEPTASVLEKNSTANSTRTAIEQREVVPEVRSSARGGIDYSRFANLDVSEDEDEDDSMADEDAVFNTVGALQNMHSKKKSEFEDWKSKFIAAELGDDPTDSRQP